MKPITDYFKKINSLTRNVKTPEKRKRENSSSSSPEQKEKMKDDAIGKWIENADASLEAKLKIIKTNSLQENEKIDLNNGNCSKNDGVKLQIKKIESTSTNDLVEKQIVKKQNSNETTESTNKKKLSLWDLPMYEDSKKLNKNSKPISELQDSNEENILENINDELDNNMSNVKNEANEQSNKKKVGQRKISDFFLSNL